MVLAKFLPRDEQFYVHFNDAANNSLEMAKLLTEVIESGPDTERQVRRLRDFEHEGDNITHRIYQALNSTFVTPLDREDIRALASTLDDFVDAIEEVGKRLWLYQMGQPTEELRLFTRILVEQAQLLADNIPHLEQPGKRSADIQRCVLELHRLENEADETLNQVLGTLFEGVIEVPQLIAAIRWGEIYHLVEDATDKGENIGHLLEGILSQYA
jgi:predicted phosphate transport protein (TIGR00153 family)